jgi:hypothetical protein
MGALRPQRALAYAWVAVVSVLITGPALLPGFALSYDLIFTPRQDLLPGSIGVGGGLPRAVPQDAVVAMVETVVPGALLEKAVLIGIPLLVGWGMLRLLPSTPAGAVAATFAIVNPFVAQRLVIGHWGLLLAYALVPWALVVARRLRAQGDPWDGLRLLLLVAAGSLTPSGSILLTVLVAPVVLLPGSAYPSRMRVLFAVSVGATWLPWLLPALLHPLGATADPDGTRVFALRGDSPGGPLASAITGGGIWNGDVVMATRGTVLPVVLALVVLLLGMIGARALARSLGNALTLWWAGVAVLGLSAALASANLQGPWGSLIDIVPGGGLARDSAKLLAPWVLILAAAAGEGSARLGALARDKGSRVAIVVGIALVPVALQPDMLGGVSGRLHAVQYPADWSVVREILQTDGRPGDVASFPWMAFRRFAWNADRTILDPAPRWLPRTTLVDDALIVRTADGLVQVSGDDPRARAISAALEDDRPLADVLPGLGIGWVLVARGTPGPQPDLAGWEQVFEGADLALYAAPLPASDPAGSPHLAPVAAVDLLLLGGLVAGIGALGLRRVRVRGARRLIP